MRLTDVRRIFYTKTSVLKAGKNACKTRKKEKQILELTESQVIGFAVPFDAGKKILTKQIRKDLLFAGLMSAF